MATIFPFRGWLPTAELAAQVAAVPYDVVNRQEARELAKGNPHSFLHVTKPEIDLPDDTDPYSDAVYAQGAAALRSMQEGGTLKQDDNACLYAYELTMQHHTQLGVVLCASVAEYDQNIVRKHEYTRPDKEDDRVRNIEALNAQSGTVFLIHRDTASIASALSQATRQPALFSFTAQDGVMHRLWRVERDDLIRQIVQGFAETGPIYIADGHHRSAAASRVAEKLREAGQANPLAEQFLAVSFPASQMQILPYNRVVRDLHGLDSAGLLQALTDKFVVEQGKAQPLRPKQFNMYLDGQWHTLTPKPECYRAADAVTGLDVSILQQQVLEPLLGIQDPRRDKRIDFVGGIRGDGELERRVAQGWAVAFALHSTSVEELLNIADAGQVMPPKSTWFEPKLRDGLVLHTLG